MSKYGYYQALKYGLVYLIDHRSTACRSADQVIHTFDCNKNNATDLPSGQRSGATMPY